MLSFRTSPPPHYIPPTKEEMRVVADRVGIKSFSRDLVADLTNLAAGGTVNPPSAFRETVRDQAERSLPAPDEQGRWWLKRESRSTDNRSEAVAVRAEDAMRYHTNVCDFLQTVDLGAFPGGTPLEQAMSLLKLLSKSQGGSGGGEGGEPLPIFTENDNSEKVAQDLHRLMDEVDSLSDEEQEMLDPEDQPESEDSEADGQRSGSKPLSALKVAEDLVGDSDKRAVLEISRTLDQFTKLQVRKQRRQEVDPEGGEVRRRPMRGLDEIGRLSPQDLLMRKRNKTLFLLKAVRGEFSVRERVTRVEKKQAIFVLLDGSGSMHGRRHWKACGVVMNRLKAVLSGDAEVWLSVFDTNLGKAEHAATPEEARTLMKKFMQRNFSGGGTNIAAAVRKAHAQIEELIRDGHALYRPEVVVLTDNDSSISALQKAEIPGTRVHGFAMESANPTLVAFARSTGGVGIDNF